MKTIRTAQSCLYLTPLCNRRGTVFKRCAAVLQGKHRDLPRSGETGRNVTRPWQRGFPGVPSAGSHAQHRQSFPGFRQSLARMVFEEDVFEKVHGYPYGHHGRENADDPVASVSTPAFLFPCRATQPAVGQNGHYHPGQGEIPVLSWRHRVDATAVIEVLCHFRLGDPLSDRGDQVAKRSSRTVIVSDGAMPRSAARTRR